MIKPAYGYRFEYGGRVVVISGDTRYCENVVKFGIGADLLIHEVAIVRPELASEPFIQRIMAPTTQRRAKREQYSSAPSPSWRPSRISSFWPAQAIRADR